jgi:hypothetical protein
MSSLIVWLLFLLFSKPNVCQVPASIFCLFHSNLARNFSNEEGLKHNHFNFFGHVVYSTFLHVVNFQDTKLSFE